MAMPTKLSRTQPTLGSITPPLPSPPSTAFFGSIASTTLISPTAVRTTGTAEPLGQLFGHARGREVEHHRPLRLIESAEGRQGQRQLLADVTALLVDDRQSVGVWILCEPHRWPPSREPFAAKVRRFFSVGSGVWSYRPSGSPPKTIGWQPRAWSNLQPSLPPAPWQASRATTNSRERIAGTSTISSTRCQVDFVWLIELADLAQTVPAAQSNSLRFQRSSTARPWTD